ncbi:MAG: hypothetical protein P3X22_002490 [Thermoprotei archaeon]|nr:hypothetical protein [Thermoprotei archaeon]
MEPPARERVSREGSAFDSTLKELGAGDRWPPLADTIEIIDLENCRDVEACIKACYGNRVLKVKASKLESIGSLPGDCTLIVEP